MKWTAEMFFTIIVISTTHPHTAHPHRYTRFHDNNSMHVIQDLQPST